ncbi:cation-translocating P-type ATPase [Glutamicibacter sp. V16R2B1]|nr:cation-translocating P-type ATPase [Glutamicibacter sp. V16R2B1]
MHKVWQTLRRLTAGRWFIPAVSGALILVSLLLSAGLGQQPAGDVFMVAAAVLAGYRIALAAGRSLWGRHVGIDLLVTVAAAGAVVIGNYWEAAAVTFLFAVGHALEAATLDRTRSALSALVAVAPDEAVVLREGQQHRVPAGQVLVGELVLVKDGAKVPVDGRVQHGSAGVDESSITGESLPVDKAAGDQVFAGTIATSGFLQVVAEGIGADTTLARIIHRVEEAQDARARTQSFFDRFATWYTPAIILLALVAGLLTSDVVLALTLLVIGCPGALVISIPVAVVAGIGRAAKDGILIKGGEYLEQAARIDTVAVDKTGTLTEGRPQLTDLVPVGRGVDAAQLLEVAARGEAGSGHPLAQPILTAAAQRGLVVPLPEQVEPVLGKGILARSAGQRILIGNPALLADHGLAPGARAAAAAGELAAAGKTPMLVALDGQVLGVVAVADTVRADAAQMVRELRAVGVKRIVMLTGDSAPVAHAIAARTGITEVRASLLPEDKLEMVRELQRGGHTVAMVGDGVNDAPALAAADIGVAMGAAGSAVAVETADVALMGDNLLRLPQAIGAARRTVRVMRQNIIIAVATVVLLLAGVFTGGVTMALGMLVHEASVLVVIGNAMRLLRRNPARRDAGVQRPAALGVQVEA